jgi:DNA-binding response OmpR family regulator
MPRTIRDLLADRATLGFVGRERELAVLERLFEEQGPLVLHLRGSPGLGKSRLVGAFAARARRQGHVVVRLDGHAIEPTEAGFVRALGGAPAATEVVVQRLADAGERVVLALDGYEELRLLDTWLRQVLIPSLPVGVRVLLVSREPPVGTWLVAPEWRGLFQSLTLEPLAEPAAIELLGQLGVGAEQARRINRFARGHPLALTLAAATARERPDLNLEAATVHRVVEQLSQAYLAHASDPLVRRGLRAGSVVRRLTIPLLRALLPDSAPDDIYERLRALPVVDPAPDGLVVQDAVRHALAADLKAADPTAHRDYRRAAWRQLRTEVAGVGRAELWRYTADMLYLIEDPVVRQTFFPPGVASFAVEPARQADAPAISRISDAHAGRRAGELLGHWWARAPQAFAVVRDPAGQTVGFSCVFERATVSDADLHRDPITAAWCAHLQRQPVEPDERVLFVRAHLGRAQGEVPTPELAAMVLDFKRAYMELRPRLRRVYAVLRELTPMWPFLQRVGFHELTDALVGLDGHPYRSAMLDFGPGSVDGWLAGLVANELAAADALLLDAGAREVIVDGQRRPLTPLEFDVLRYLLEREGQAVPRSALLDDVWHDTYQGGSNVVDVVVRSLRKKLGRRASAIETVTRVGYRLRRP